MELLFFGLLVVLTCYLAWEKYVNAVQRERELNAFFADNEKLRTELAGERQDFMGRTRETVSEILDRQDGLIRELLKNLEEDRKQHEIFMRSMYGDFTDRWMASSLTEYMQNQVPSPNTGGVQPQEEPPDLSPDEDVVDYTAMKPGEKRRFINAIPPDLAGSSLVSGLPLTMKEDDNGKEA